MRKNYFLTLLFTLCLSAFSFGQVIITELADPNNNSGARYVELYVVGPNSVDFTDWELIRYTNAGTTTSSNRVDLTSLGTLAQGSFAIIAANGTTFQSTYGTAADISAGTGGPADSNGDDKIAIVDASDTTIDIFGEPGVDSNNANTAMNFEDGRAERAASVTAPVDVWDAAEWNTDNDQGFGSGAQDAPAGFDPKAWIGTATDPTISFTDPTNNAVFNPGTTQTTIGFSVLNFTLSGDNGSGMSDGTGDGYIVGTSVENGGTPEAINIFSLSQQYESLEPGDMVTLTAELVDNAGNSLSPAVTAMVTFSVASYTQVGDIATLRAGTEGDYYELTGEAVLTYIGTSRNQKYIEDSSAAILIDDNDGTVTTSYNIGDGITGLRGRLSSFGGVLQIVPEEDPGAATSMGNTITPQVVSIANLLANLDDYESEWITVNDVTFPDADGTATFATTNYDITDGVDTMVFRVHFSGTDIEGTVIPFSSVNITGLAGEFNGTSQIFGTSLANFVLGVQRDEIAGYSAYPNPVTGNQLTVTTSSIDTKKVDLFNVLGRRVFTQSFSGTSKTLTLSNLSSGIYILKVTEGNRIATQKVIIE